MTPEAEQTQPTTPKFGEIFHPFRRFKGALVPETLLRGYVTRGAALLYGQLARYSGRDGMCFPGQARVAADFMVTIRTVQRWLRELTGKALLKAIRRGHGTRSNAYYFLWHPILDPAQLELPFVPAAEPEMPPRKPVQNERKTGYDSRQKCRVNGPAFLSEEGQGFLSRTERSRNFVVNAGGKHHGAGPTPVASIVAELAIVKELLASESRDEDESAGEPEGPSTTEVPEPLSNNKKAVHDPIEPAHAEPINPQSEPESAEQPQRPVPPVSNKPDRRKTPTVPICPADAKRRAAAAEYERKYWARAYDNSAFLDAQAEAPQSLFAKGADNISSASKTTDSPARAPAPEVMPENQPAPEET